MALNSHELARSHDELKISSLPQMPVTTKLGKVMTYHGGLVMSHDPLHT